MARSDRLKLAKGDKFHRWTVIDETQERIPRGDYKILCRCECGTERKVLTWALNTGSSKSCGCLQKEKAASLKKTHGMSDTKVYDAWGAMLERCRNPNNKKWRIYGGRGVTVCDRWDPAKGGSFENFYADMGDPPSPKHSIDKDKLGDGTLYSPETCCWLTPYQQNQLLSHAVRISHRGKTQTVREWAKELELSPATIHNRRRRGLSTAEVLAPRQRKKPINRRTEQLPIPL